MIPDTSTGRKPVKHTAPSKQEVAASTGTQPEQKPHELGKLLFISIWSSVFLQKMIFFLQRQFFFYIASRSNVCYYVPGWVFLFCRLLATKSTFCAFRSFKTSDNDTNHSVQYQIKEVYFLLALPKFYFTWALVNQFCQKSCNQIEKPCYRKETSGPFCTCTLNGIVPFL